MNPYITMLRPPVTGWLRLAAVNAVAREQRRPESDLPEPVIFRSECFAEDLLETSPSMPARSGAAVVPA